MTKQTAKPNKQVDLAIELSSREGSIALGIDGRCIDSEIVKHERRHDDDLMPAIDRMFKRNDLAPADLTHIMVSLGPGGFTGLRIAVTTAKSLALAINVNIIPVMTADVVAETCGCDRTYDRMLVVLATKRDSAWCTWFKRSDDGDYWIQAHEGCLANPAELVAANSCNISHGTDKTVVIAESPGEQLIQTSMQANCQIATPRWTACACWSVGNRMRAEGVETSVAAQDLEPFYGRIPEAVRLWKK